MAPIQMLIFPDKERPIGSGELVVSVVIAPICQTATHYSFPTDPTAWTGCGAYVTESVGSIAPGLTNRTLISLNTMKAELPHPISACVCHIYKSHIGLAID